MTEIRKADGATAVVLKWDEAGLRNDEGAEALDQAMKLVVALQPNERQRKSAVEIQKQKPVPLKHIAEQISHFVGREVKALR